MYAKSNFKNYTTMQELNLFSVLESSEQTTSEKENLVKVSHHSSNTAKYEEEPPFWGDIYDEYIDFEYTTNY